MSFSLKILRPARKVLDKMDDNLARKVYIQLEKLKEDPFRPRPGMDIDKIEGNLRPPGYRLRAGRWRVEYVVLEGVREVRVGRIFPRRRETDYK